MKKLQVLGYFGMIVGGWTTFSAFQAVKIEDIASSFTVSTFAFGLSAVIFLFKW